MAKAVFMAALLASLLATMGGCSTAADRNEVPTNMTTLQKCPSSPNCVSSQEVAGRHRIEPIAINGDPAVAWQTLQKILAEDSSITVISSTDRHVRAEARTRLLRFTDDVDFLLDKDAGIIDMRSASRIGYSDLGKNRSRLEALREKMREAGVVGE